MHLSVIVSVIGVLLLTTTVTNTPNYFYDPKVQTLPFFEWFYQIYQPQQLAFAQDEEDEEEEDSKDKDNDDEESTKDEDEESESNNETIAEPLEQLSDQFLDVSQESQAIQEQAQQTEQELEQVKQELNNILIAGNWTNPNKIQQEQEPVLNLTNDQTFLDPSCNCTNPPIEPPNQNVMPPTATQPPTGLQQIIINPSSVKNVESWGGIKDPRYTEFYNVKNTIDNKVDEYSFWSQYDKSGFNIELHPQALKNFEVCSAEIVVHNPKSVQSTLTIDKLYNYTGILDNTTEKVEFDSCYKNVKQITMSFDGAEKKYTSIGELKLFGKLLNPQPTTPTTGEVQKIEIKNSNAEISIINSTVSFKFDSKTAQGANYNVITIPTTGGQ